MLFTNSQFLSNLTGSSGWSNPSIGPWYEFTEVAGRYSNVDYDYSATENKFIIVGRSLDYSTVKAIPYEVNSVNFTKGTELTFSPGSLWPNKFVKISNTYGLYGSQFGCPNIQNIVNFNFTNGSYSSYGGVHNCNGGTISLDPVSSTKALYTMISNGHGATYGIGGANIKVILANHNGSSVSSISSLDYGAGADQSYSPWAVSRPYGETRALLVYKTNITLASTVGYLTVYEITTKTSTFIQ